ncbi:MAG: sulfur oxidation c-type cytochrome SoxA [Geminicoccaceae bacterium]
MKGMRLVAGGAAIALLLVGVAGNAISEEERKSIPAPADNPLPELISGYEFRTPETQALQDDDFENPGFLWLDIGDGLWSEADGAAGKSCADCHGDAQDMAGVAATFPKYFEPWGKIISLEQRINVCREKQMEAAPFEWESDELLGMTAFVRHQSLGMPVNVSVDGPAEPFFKAGEEYYYSKVGQLDMSCANCHEDNWGNYIRADLLSQGQSNGFPTYRLKWQKIGSLHRRFRGCNDQVRASKLPYGDDTYNNLELYVAWRGNGLPIETPAVRQ